jgi:hypothetical protein
MLGRRWDSPGVARRAGSTRRARKGDRGSTSLLSLMANGERMETDKELVRDGFALRYVRFDNAGEFTDADREAREKRCRLWADKNPIPPWEWRKACQRSPVSSRLPATADPSFLKLGAAVGIVSLPAVGDNVKLTCGTARRIGRYRLSWTTISILHTGFSGR